VLNSVRQDSGVVNVRILDVADHWLLVHLSDGLLNDFRNQGFLLGVRVLLSMNMSKNWSHGFSSQDLSVSSGDVKLRHITLETCVMFV